ncbi:putative oxidoreductase MexAM1_META1p0182 [Dermatophagoides farinae]|uniref:putative oxidoreductase MexAM1_META1p0182 n=1 Tax=Dermatophagoides farinae TaxID=6954 RepID=UPI003F5F665D
MTSTIGKKYDFTGKVALITGSSSGIGAAIALQFAQYGAQVTITGRDAETLANVGKEIEEKCGHCPLQIIGDLIDQYLPEKLINETMTKFGRLDFLVNNAGIGTTAKSLENENFMTEFDKVFAINVRAPVQLIQLAVPHLEKTKGNIINISSIASLTAFSLLYGSSKAALDMITKTSAQELGPKGIRVNSINPGPVVTSIYRSMGITTKPMNMKEEMKKRTLLNMAAEPIEIANLASFLASNDARNITGSIVVSDDFLVNNAAIGTTAKSFENENLMAEFDKIFAVNVRAPVQLIQLAVPHLEKTKGNIINISSIASLEAFSLIYGPSKAALDMITKTSAQELGPKGIRVNSIVPGPVVTSIYRSFGIATKRMYIEEEVKKRSLLNMIPEPIEIANLASFLVSDDARNITGSIVLSDTGALLMQKN